MLSVFQQPQDSKQLYFRLKNSFGIFDSHLFGSGGSISGVYAIFKDGVCYYVGQSSNVASRLATHFSGKYKMFDEVILFIPEDDGFSDFYERDKACQKEILLNNERHCIDWLKPVENILVSDSNKINDEYLFSRLQAKGSKEACFTILNSYGLISIVCDWDYLYLDYRVIDPIVRDDQLIDSYRAHRKLEDDNA